MKNKIVFANISITAKDRELLDYGDLVVEAVLKNQEPRRTSSATYHFMDVDIGYLKEGDPLSISLFGRFVKDTELISEQVIVDGKIVHKYRKLPNAPSAFFVFNLADHRIAFLEETRYAPSVRTFGNTLGLFIRRLYETRLRQKWAAAKEVDPKATLAQTKEAYPLPIVHAVPIADRIAVATFVKKFSHIQSLAVHVVRRNQDESPGSLFEALSGKLSLLEPTSARVIVNGGKDGLNQAQTEEFVASLAEHDYEDTRISGLDLQGAKLSGTNADYSLARSLEEVPSDRVERAQAVYNVYVSAKHDKQIEVAPRRVDVIGEKLVQLAKTYG